MKTSRNRKKYYPRRPGIFERERNKPSNKTKQNNKLTADYIWMNRKLVNWKKIKLNLMQ